MFVETTPGGQLVQNAKAERDRAEQCKGKCFPCESVKGINKKSRCSKNNIGYEIPCITFQKRGVSKVYGGKLKKCKNKRS
jgi:hypothetical protein